MEKPKSRSAIISSMCSIPTLSLICPGRMPAFCRSTSECCSWVVDDGLIISVLESPTLATLKAVFRDDLILVYSQI